MPFFVCKMRACVQNVCKCVQDVCRNLDLCARRKRLNISNIKKCVQLCASVCSILLVCARVRIRF